MNTATTTENHREDMKNLVALLKEKYQRCIGQVNPNVQNLQVVIQTLLMRDMKNHASHIAVSRSKQICLYRKMLQKRVKMLYTRFEQGIARLAMKVYKWEQRHMVALKSGNGTKSRNKQMKNATNELVIEPFKRLQRRAKKSTERIYKASATVAWEVYANLLAQLRARLYQFELLIPEKFGRLTGSIRDALALANIHSRSIDLDIGPDVQCYK